MFSFFRRLFGLRDDDTRLRVQWVDPRTLQPGPIQHEELTEDQLDQVRLIHETFADVDGLGFHERVDNFKRDFHVDQEISLCVAMANAYTAYCRDRHLSAEAKKDVYRVLLMRTMAMPDEVLERLKLKELSADDAVAVMNCFTWQPAVVEEALARSVSLPVSRPADKRTAPTPDVKCRVVATREPGSPLWIFYLVNDGETEIETAELEAVKYEWGDEYVGGESPHVQVTGLAAGGQALIWKDDGSSEMRTDLWLRVTHHGAEAWLLFEFPKLYRQSEGTLIAYPERMPKGP